jgi:hypothetical protein
MTEVAGTPLLNPGARPLQENNIPQNSGQRQVGISAIRLYGSVEDLRIIGVKN